MRGEAEETREDEEKYKEIPSPETEVISKKWAEPRENWRSKMKRKKEVEWEWRSEVEQRWGKRKIDGKDER